MEKTLTIDGRQVKFKSSGGTIIRYRNQFNSELITELADLEKLSEIKQDFSRYTTKGVEQIIWVLAKTADDSIPDILPWFDSFDSFPIFDVWLELQTMAYQSFGTKIKNA